MSDERVSSISKARTLEEIADFWDTHSLADYEDQTYEVEMTFDPAARRAVVNIDPELMEELRRIARERKVSTQTLVNLWLRQRTDQLHGQSAISG
jgi:hypothetical protein